MDASFDIVVVGLGAMGAATVYQLARRGVRVLGIDRFAPPHDQGSSHGETRITRQAIGEGKAYVPLVLKSHDIWRRLERDTGAHLLLECGFIAVDTSGGSALMHGKPGFVEATADAARAFGIAHEMLTPGEARRRHPGLQPPDDALVYYEPGGGLVFPERCIAAQLGEAQRLGAAVRLNEPVSAIEPLAGSVRIRTGSGTIEAGRVVVTAGGWTPRLTGGAAMARMQLLRQVLHWYAADEPDRFRPGPFPTFIWTHGPGAENSFYGFPMVPGMTQGVKVATEQYIDALARPEDIDRNVTAAEVAAMFANHVSGRLATVTPHVLRSATCLYTQAPDGDFVIDRDIMGDRVLIVSACSGHGFKHSAGVGDLIAAHLIDDAAVPAEFAAARAGLAA